MKQLTIALLLLITQPSLFLSQSQKKATSYLPGSELNTYCFTTSDNDQIIYYANNNQIILYDIINQQVSKSIDIQAEAPITSILVNAEANTLLLGTKAGKLMAISIYSGQLLYEKDYNAGSINALALSNDGFSVFCGCENGMVYIQSLKDESDASEFYQHGKAITAIEISAEKKLIAISSGDGTISLFRLQTQEHIDNLHAGKEWIRKVSINHHKDRLLGVGDDGNLYEWNIANIDKPRLINQSKASRNWLLSLDIGHEGKAECWGGLDHILRIRTTFGTYEEKLKGPILKTRFINAFSPEIAIACCVLEQGIQIIYVKDMKFKPNF